MNRHDRRAAGQRSSRVRHHTNTSRVDLMPATMLRTSCNECGGPITWLDNDGLDVLGSRVGEFLAWMGDTRAGLVAIAHGDWWRCDRSSCDNFGVVMPPGE